jgi:predicted esterase
VIERSPEGGLPYRLTLGAEATAEKPHRLIVWLHPSGGFSYNAPVEALAPLFVRHGFAMLVTTRKDFRGWTHDDARKLLGVTLPDAAEQSGVDARRPLLMGFSSGGQVALELWLTKPGLYGGLILDAAYPVEEREGDAVVLAPPRGDAVKTIPIFVLVGEKDVLLPVWKRAEKPWREAGVPLTVRVVPGKGHEWLFGEAEVAALEEWLAALPGGAGEGAQAVAPAQEEPEPAVQP